MSSAAPISAPIHGPTLSHDCLLYRTPADYLAGVLPYLTAAIDAGQPAFVAVPEANLRLLQRGLGDQASAVELADMTRIGRNPARIIPAISRFLDAHPRHRARFVGEPIWAGRSAPEIHEATRHEAMLNTAFADAALDILCPYDVSALGPRAVADAWRTHPAVVDVDERRISPHYTDPHEIYASDEPLSPAAAADVRTIAVVPEDLAAVRRFVLDFAAEVDLGPRRTQDLVLAVNELATNTIVHSSGSGTLQIWSEPDSVVCEIRDGGLITDPFAGRHQPDDAADHGRGLWMANQLCDLVQIRSSGAGTTIRLHVDRPAG